MAMIALLTRVLVALAVWPATDLAAGGGTKAAAPAGGISPGAAPPPDWLVAADRRSVQRVYYLFSPDVAAQRRRAARLQRRLGAERLVAIARTQWGGRLSAAVPVAAVAGASELPAYIEARLDADGDYFALIGADGVRSGRGRDLEALVAADIVTEVDESTWGKVKDLFK